MIYGLFGALLITGRRMGVDWRQMAGVVVLNLALSFGIQGIDWRAHIGGLIGGSIATNLINGFHRPKKSLGYI